MSSASLYMPHLVLVLGAIILLGLGAWNQIRTALYPIAVASVIAAGIACLAAYPSAPPTDAALAAFFDTGALSAFYLPVLCLLGVVALFFFGPFAMERQFDRDEPYAMLLFALCGALLLAGGSGWLSLFLGLELLSLPLYVLIASHPMHCSSDAGTEAALKYFVLGATASACLLFGIALVYAGSGSLSITTSLAQPEGANTVLLGLCFVLAGFGFKLALAPFHLWAADVYQGAPAPVSGFLASVAKASAVAALLRIAMALGPQFWPAFTVGLWIMAAASMVLGNFAALRQTSLKRMLGYSSVAHMGYLLMAVLSVREAGPGPVLFYSVTLAVMDLGAFGGLSLLSSRESEADQLDDVRAQGEIRPWSAALLGLSLLSLAGLPPTAGFTGKLFVFRAAMSAGHLWLAAIGIVAAIVSIAYYLRALAALYLRKASINWTPPVVGISGSLAIILVFGALLLLGIIPTPVYDAVAASGIGMP
ncbi:NADH-quinone oxidoreductase subunit N [Desulfovibrio inopinatus]|uniref:NADH-quinone oxidoreductase subunit N n=1 Tax=Desulfovibrio inopinatus TaxID=102109 RepID=UPI0003FDBF38|nr:NADH-quinone oxidoreductase subunit N [Desulfovibrio inopinatus]